ncbi:hypothetical protein OIO90_000958 [Microbotryomycetes sp. JL221]|nr:hypothetical protein OIO90_000958 [Microbotryomycetes sp. JL221]
MSQQSPFKDVVRQGRSSLEDWDRLAPPPDDGPNSHVRVSDGLPRISGTTSRPSNMVNHDEHQDSSTTTTAREHCQSWALPSAEDGYCSPPALSRDFEDPCPNSNSHHTATTAAATSTPIDPQLEMLSVPHPETGAAVNRARAIHPAFERGLDDQRQPLRSTIRRAPSPATLEKQRPTPYPPPKTSSSTKNKIVPSIRTETTPSAAPVVVDPIGPAMAEFVGTLPASIDRKTLIDLVTAPSIPPPVTVQRKPHTRVFSADHVPRPRNSFMLFRTHVSSRFNLLELLKLTHHSQVSKVLGTLWSTLAPDQKRAWDELALKEKERHKLEYPEYSYRPKRSGAMAVTSGQKEQRTSTPKSRRKTKTKPKLGRAFDEGESAEDELGSDGDAEYRSKAPFSDSPSGLRGTRSQSEAESRRKPSDKQTIASALPTPDILVTPQAPSRARRNPKSTSSGIKRSTPLTRPKPYTSPMSGGSRPSQASPTSTVSTVSPSPRRLDPTVTNSNNAWSSPTPLHAALETDPALDSDSPPEHAKNKTYGALTSDKASRRRPPAMNGVSRQVSTSTGWPSLSTHETVDRQPSIQAVLFPGSSDSHDLTVQHNLVADQPRGVTPSILSPLEEVASTFEYDNSLLLDPKRIEVPSQSIWPRQEPLPCRVTSLGSRWILAREHAQSTPDLQAQGRQSDLSRLAPYHVQALHPNPRYGGYAPPQINEGAPTSVVSWHDQQALVLAHQQGLPLGPSMSLEAFEATTKAMLKTLEVMKAAAEKPSTVVIAPSNADSRSAGTDVWLGQVNSNGVHDDDVSLARPMTAVTHSAFDTPSPHDAPSFTCDSLEAMFDFEAATKFHPAESYHMGTKDLFVQPNDVFGSL